MKSRVTPYSFWAVTSLRTAPLRTHSPYSAIWDASRSPRRTTRDVATGIIADSVTPLQCVGHGLHVDRHKFVAIVGRELIELRLHAVEEPALDAGLDLRLLRHSKQPDGHALDGVASHVAASDQRGTSLRHVAAAQKQCEGTLLQLEHQHVGERTDQNLQWLAAA